jgi:cytochrome c oxidase subunit II
MPTKSASDRRHFIIVGALIAVTTVIMDFALKAAMPLGVQASIEALTIDALIGWHLTMIAFLFSLVVVFMIYAMVVFRKKDGDDSEGEHFEGNTFLEIVWTVAPLIFVVVFSFYGINALAEVTRGDSNEVQVKAVGVQWSWRFEYPNGIVSPELVLPVNQRVNVTLQSDRLGETAAVLHSFWIVEMRVKQDVVPGTETNLRFTPTLTGDFKVRCAELCGRGHYSMESPVRILEAAEYEQWVNEQLAAQNLEVVQTDSAEATE